MEILHSDKQEEYSFVKISQFFHKGIIVAMWQDVCLKVNATFNVDVQSVLIVNAFS